MILWSCLNALIRSTIITPWCRDNSYSLKPASLDPGSRMDLSEYRALHGWVLPPQCLGTAAVTHLDGNKVPQGLPTPICWLVQHNLLLRRLHIKGKRKKKNHQQRNSSSPCTLKSPPVCGTFWTQRVQRLFDENSGSYMQRKMVFPRRASTKDVLSENFILKWFSSNNW